MLSTMKRGEDLMYPVHDVLRNSRVELRQNFIYNGNTLVGLLPVRYVGGSGAVEELDTVGLVRWGGTVLKI